MKIERVDEKTVKCFISNEELEEYDLTYKDFLMRSDKAKEIVEEIIAQAVAEVDYKPPQFAFDLQIMMLPDQGMILTFSEKTPEDVKNGVSLMNYLREMRRILGEKLGVDSQTFAGMLAQAASNVAAVSQTNQNISETVVHTVESPSFAIFRFSSMRELCGYANILPKNLRVISRLYRDGDAYYLYLERGGASYERYSRCCVQAMEFGILYAATEERKVYLEEHGECLIPEKAIARLKV